MSGSERTNREGFSLIEVMVAFAILSIGMLGIGKMLIVSMESDQVAQRTRLGDAVAATEIEAIMHMAKEVSPTDYVAQVGQNSTAETAGQNRVIDSEGAFVVDVQVVSNFPTSGIARLIVKVGWGGSRCNKDNVKDHVLPCKHTTEMYDHLIMN